MRASAWKDEAAPAAARGRSRRALWRGIERHGTVHTIKQRQHIAQNNMTFDSKTLAAAAASLVVSTAFAAHDAGNWTATWHASQEPAWGGDFVLSTGTPQQISNETLRQAARVSLGGKRIR